MVSVFTFCSSNTVRASSNPVAMYISPFLKGIKKNSIISYSRFIFANSNSIVYSFDSFSPMSSHALTWSIKPRSMMLWKVNSSVDFTSNSTVFESCSQCLSFIPSFLRAIVRGRYGLYLSRFTLTVSPFFKITGMSFSLKNLITLFIFFEVCRDLYFHIKCI